MSKFNLVAVICFGLLFMTMKSSSRKYGILLRCHAFASNANRRQLHNSRSAGAWRSGPQQNVPFVNRGGESRSRDSFLSSERELTRTSRLSSSASPLKESNLANDKDEFEKRVNSSLKISSGGPMPVSFQSFGGLKYQDTSNSSSSFRVVFVLGGPGAGKGTQCELLIQNYPCHHLSAGQLLRDEAEKKDGSSEHAKLIEECLVAGKIVPVEISLSLLQNAMREAEGNDSLIFLIDGFPRNFDNLDGWTRCMTKSSDNNDNDAAKVVGVLSYDCPLPILEERVMKRSKDSGRSDDNLESLRRRFKTFQDETMPVVDVLREIDERTSSLMKVVDIEGQRSLDDVWEETQKSMNSFIANDVLSANMRLLEAIARKDADAYRILCADEMFEDNNSSDSDLAIMEAHETEIDNQFDEINIACAEITFITGKKISISYDRTSGSGVTFRETRVWSHKGPKGWKMVHFYRSR